MTSSDWVRNRGRGSVALALMLVVGGQVLLASGCGSTDAKTPVPESDAGSAGEGPSGLDGGMGGIGDVSGDAGSGGAGSAGDASDEAGAGGAGAGGTGAAGPGGAGAGGGAGGEGGMPVAVGPLPWPTLCTGLNVGGWCWVTPASGTAVAFTDAMNGVLANGPSFFRTTDGGRSWSLAKIDTADVAGINDIHFASSTVGVAVGTRPNSTPVTLRSADAGATWATVPSGVTTPLRAVSFGSATVGAAVGGPGDIAYTIDGGQSWAAATVPVITSFQSIAFATPSIAVAGATTGNLFRSTDGGKNWTGLASVGTSSGAESIKFSSATTGFYVNGDGIRRSDDAGLTWALIPGASALHELDFGDAKHGVAVGPFGNSVMTSDGGDTWTKLVGAQSELHSVSFAGTSTVVALGQAIQRSTDSGKTWGQTVPTVDVVPPSINSLRYADAKTAVAVGGFTSTLIARTTDGGITWDGVQPPTTDPLAAVDFASPTVGVAVGKGVIVRSVDGGATWTVVESDGSRRLYAVRFASPTVGVALGAQGLVLRTTDGGATWSPITSFGTASLTAVAFSSSTDGVLGNDNGHLFRTTDAGLTWLPTVGNAGAFETVTSIDYADSSTVIAVGSHGFVLRSSDGGATWFTISAGDPQGPDATAVAFASPTLGYELVATGIIRRTTDGGQTWTEPFPHLPSTFAAIDFADAKNGLIGGVFSSILRTTTGGQ